MGASAGRAAFRDASAGSIGWVGGVRAARGGSRGAFVALVAWVGVGVARGGAYGAHSGAMNASTASPGGRSAEQGVLILDAGMGEGHRAVGGELALRLRGRGRRVDCVDVLELLPRGLGAALRSSYRAAVRRTPWLYDAVYSMFLEGGRGPGSTPLARLAVGGLRDAVDASRPGLVVPVFHLAAQITGFLRQRGGLAVPTAVLITDFAVHRQWLHPGNDVHLCVSADAAQQVRARLGRPGLAVGPVVPERFSRLTAADAAGWPARLGVAAEGRPVVLISTGSWGVADGLAGTAVSVARAGFLPVVLCGRDARARARLSRLAGVRAYGWIEDVAGLMAASSALIDNAAGQTAVQALAAGLPVIGYRPIAGHGRQGVIRMAHIGVTEYARTRGELLHALDRLTRPGEARDVRVRAGRALFSGDAADYVERAMVGLARHGHGNVGTV